jgi:hypothetical protein
MVRLDAPPFMRLMDAAIARWDTSPQAVAPDVVVERVAPTAD